MRESRTTSEELSTKSSDHISFEELSGPSPEGRLTRTVSVTSPSLKSSFRYVDHPSFHEPNAWTKIMEAPASSLSSRETQSRPASLDSFSKVLRHPLLSKENTEALFLKMNFLKLCAATEVLSSENQVLKPDQLEKVGALLSQATEVRNTIALSNARLAVMSAHGFDGPDMTKEDLASLGFECLLKCVEFYDCSLSTAFSNYAITSIRRTYARACTSARVRAATVSVDDEGFIEPEDRRTNEATAEAHRDQVKAVIRAAVGQLPERERSVITDYVLDEKTLQEAGDRIGVTREGARLIKLRGMSRLKTIMGEGSAEDFL